MEIEKAFKKLLVKEPFYGLFCLGLPKSITDSPEGIPTMGVVRKGLHTELVVNREFWEKNTDDQQLALLKHELSHICFQHMFLSDSFPDGQAFNVAADMEVNSYIENLPPGGCFPKDIGMGKGLGTKAYYEKLMELQQQRQKAQSPRKPCNGGQGGQDNQQQGDDQQDNAPEDQQDQQQPQEDKGEEERKDVPDSLPKDRKLMDSHKGWEEFRQMPEATQQLIKNNIDSLVKSTAEQVERQCGTIPGELKELVQKLREKKPEVFNWKAYFRRMLGSIYDVHIKSTRRKQSKRFIDAAGIQHKKKVSILVAVDTSASVSSKELQDFFSEISHIHKAGAKVTVIQCDARINSIEEYDGKMEITVKGRGGTDFNPPVEYYTKHRKEYASLIYFTDGECSLPVRKPSGMVWVITSNGYHQDYPGKTIYIPKDNK